MTEQALYQNGARVVRAEEPDQGGVVIHTFRRRGGGVSYAVWWDREDAQQIGLRHEHLMPEKPAEPRDLEEGREDKIQRVFVELANRIGLQRLSPDLVRGIVNEWERS